jgi:hypothetical protein
MSERGGGLPLPASPPKIPGFPSNTLPIVFEGFEGVNTHVSRVAIQPSQMSVCDGFMPFGPSYLLAVPGAGPLFWTATNQAGYENVQIAFFAFGNIGDLPVLIISYADGSVWQVSPVSPTSAPPPNGIRFMPPGTIINPSSILGFSQWGSQYIIIAAPQPNGYWLWDGTTLFGAGGLSPQVTITNSGSGYTSQPNTTLFTTGGGSGEIFTFDIENGEVINIHVVAPGTGFAAGDFSTLRLYGGGSDDMADGTVVILPGAGLSGVQVLDGGSRYSSQTFAQVVGDGSGASVSLTAQLGTITGVAIQNPGTGYTTASIVVTDPAGTGSGFSASVELSGGQILAAIGDMGSGYVTPPTVTVLGDGQNAQVIAQISGGQVINLVTVNPGFGYTKGVLDFSGGNNGASATVSLMPFGVSGTAVEVAFSRVWVANGSATAPVPPKARVVFSAPGDPADFSPADGAGAFVGTDSFLRIGYHALRQTNGFLYLIGDSSINYVSGVQTTSSGTPPVASTTFSNLNADPQIGSPWPGSVQVLARNIVFANTAGVYVSYGGAVTKISDDLDGLYQSADQFTAIGASTQNFTSAVAHLFGVTPVYVLLLPLLDPVTSTFKNKLLCWNGKKWFTTSQDRPVTMIATQEINSVLIAWGSDGLNIFTLFTVPRSYPRMLQSKLWATPSYFYTKTNLVFLGIAQAQSVNEAELNIYLDSEAGSTGPFTVPLGSLIEWVNNSGTTIHWTNDSSTTIEWSTSAALGLPTVFGPIPAGQSGRLLGMTVRTSMEQGAINSFTMLEQTFETNV